MPINKEQITAIIAVVLSVMGLWSGLGSSRPVDPPPPVPEQEEPAKVNVRDHVGGGVRLPAEDYGFDRDGRDPFRAADVFVEPTLQALRSPPPSVAMPWALPGGELTALSIGRPAPVLSDEGLPDEVPEPGVPEPTVPDPDAGGGDDGSDEGSGR